MKLSQKYMYLCRKTFAIYQNKVMYIISIAFKLDTSDIIWSNAQQRCSTIYQTCLCCCSTSSWLSKKISTYFEMPQSAWGLLPGVLIDGASGWMLHLRSLCINIWDGFTPHHVSVSMHFVCYVKIFMLYSFCVFFFPCLLIPSCVFLLLVIYFFRHWFDL